MQNKAGATQHCLEAHGPALLRAVVRAAVATCPQRLLRSLASLLHALLNHAVLGQTFRECFAQVMATDEVIGEPLLLVLLPPCQASLKL